MTEVPPRVQFTTDDVQRIKKLYVDDELSIREVAAAVDRTYSAVWNVLDREGVQMRHTTRKPRKRTGKTRAPQVNTTPDEQKAIAAMYQAGHALTVVAKRFNRAPGTIQRILVAMGVERRPIGRTHRLATRHWCGKPARHAPHVGCNGFGLLAGPPEGLCSRADRHPPHPSCDGFGVVE